ncbi:MAG: PIN domain-containing protein [Candidatus Promineofilum sp.]|nr:PIN domain-containing protein [Promineifilum sp.]MBP9656476.1 PIN domain-containing protein [Promineifilum sp.]
MFTHLLDTSAWFIHVFKEPGSEQITELFRDEKNQVAISAISLVEMYARLKSAGRASEFDPTVEFYQQLFHAILPVTEKVALRAVSLRDTATTRLPTIDSLIAATAALQGAVLVHRDAHFSTLSPDQVQQQALSEP